MNKLIILILTLTGCASEVVYEPEPAPCPEPFADGAGGAGGGEEGCADCSAENPCPCHPAGTPAGYCEACK